MHLAHQAIEVGLSTHQEVQKISVLSHCTGEQLFAQHLRSFGSSAFLSA